MPGDRYLPDVSRETTDRLNTYVALIQKWTGKINLVAPSQVDHLWTRHILDCLQIAPLLPASATSITDIGSGGGLPGLVLAIHDKEYCPQRHISLVESDQRKAAFLRTVIRELDLNATVFAERIEKVDIPPADVVTARALAPLARLLELAAPLIKPDGLAIFAKGQAAIFSSFCIGK